MELALPAGWLHMRSPLEGLLMTRRSGFTLIELVIVIIVGGLILTIVGRALGDVRQRIAADQALKTFESMHARARAHAIERGTDVFLTLDSTGDSASIRIGADVIETIHFGAELGVDVSSNAAVNPVQVCMTARGYGDSDCMSYNNTLTVFFGARGDTASIQLLPLGQLKR
jgi:prepilin-type N-terminal cleavage/methylation domain-containing protein